MTFGDLILPVPVPPAIFNAFLLAARPSGIRTDSSLIEFGTSIGTKQEKGREPGPQETQQSAALAVPYSSGVPPTRLINTFLQVPRPDLIFSF